jgi:Tol biopolymer transport system component
MRRLGVGVILTALASVMLAAGADRNPNAERLLKAAMNTELVDGNVKAAIDQYKRIVDQYGRTDRATAAQALLRMAEAYQKLGDAQAKSAYERLVREYGDQREAVAVARMRLGGSTATAVAGIIARQVWTGPNVDTYGSVSPDGRLLSFTDWSTGDLALHDVATGQDRRLTNKKDWNDAQFAMGSAFSRDGKQVAYGWLLISPAVPAKDHFAEVRISDLNGGTPRVLFTDRDLDGLYVHDWSPDGKWLAAALERKNRTAQIALVSTADGAVRVLKSIDWRGVSEIAFSPDGKYLAYDLPVNADSEQREIHVMTLDGGRETSPVARPANDRVLGWSPDGKALLFASDRSGLSGVWSLPVADGKPLGEPELIRANINPTSLGMTRSGALYYGTATSGNYLYVAAADFENGKVLSPPVIIPKTYVGPNASPQWSPDGKYLAYLSRRDSNSRATRMTALAIRSMETGRVRELRSDLADLYSTDSTRPLWAPDGSSLVVNGTGRNGRRGIYRIDAQSGGAAPLVMSDAAADSQLAARALSPDGRVLYLTSRVRTQEQVLLAHDLPTGKEREIARRKGWGRGLSVSPDGRFLAVLARDTSSQSSSLQVIAVEGGEPRELLRASAPEILLGAFVAWTPDGQSLLFMKDKGDGTPRELWRIAADGSTPRKVGLDGDWVSSLGIPGRDGASIHPDGRQVAFTMGESKLEIWALGNFLPRTSTRP